jgi:hypothetical protein
MKLFVAFLVLCFLAGMIGRPQLAVTVSDRRVGWFVAALGVLLVVGYYVFHRI